MCWKVETLAGAARGPESFAASGLARLGWLDWGRAIGVRANGCKPPARRGSALAADECGAGHSWRRASTGSMVAARQAGYRPKTTPTPAEIKKARIGALGVMIVRISA